MKLETFFTSIADKMRELLGPVEKIKPKNFVNMLIEIFNAGKKSAYDEFWDGYQQNGERLDYYCAFAGKGWNNTTFKPKYDIIIDGNATDSAIYLFDRSRISGSLKQLLNNYGVKLRFQNIGRISRMQRLFYNAPDITELPVIDFSSATLSSKSDLNYLNSTISWIYSLRTVEKFIFPTDVNFAGNPTNGSSIFAHCANLSNITFEGTCRFMMDFSGSPLSADSVKSLLDHLDTATYNGTRTITLKATSKTAYNDKYGDWDGRIAQLTTSGNWTFSIV